MSKLQEFRHLIQAGIQAYAVESGTLRSHMTATYVSWWLSGREGLSLEDQFSIFMSCHQALVVLEQEDPDDDILKQIHELVHESLQIVADRLGKEISGVTHHMDQLGMKPEEDPLVTNKDDFDMWLKDLPSADQIEQQVKNEGTNKSEE